MGQARAAPSSMFRGKGALPSIAHTMCGAFLDGQPRNLPKAALWVTGQVGPSVSRAQMTGFGAGSGTAGR